MGILDERVTEAAEPQWEIVRVVLPPQPSGIEMWTRPTLTDIAEYVEGLDLFGIVQQRNVHTGELRWRPATISGGGDVTVIDEPRTDTQYTKVWWCRSIGSKDPELYDWGQRGGGFPEVERIRER
ncbi:hypothetical protein MFAL_31060 [Mycolicibacterium fallax]|nr:hypothetical protein MFAL_31060 [Mycolicibacterium fallax]